ncbi:hypothetical protein KR009_004968 [Drosophila setifemur]|nr:hypothetical protein KR009_004968 [Drosophila setifemur]
MGSKFQEHRDLLEPIQRRGSVILSQAQQHSRVLAENLLKNTTGKVANNLQFSKKPPKAYRFLEIYSDRKNQMILQRVEEERKQREFHSRPMPNFQEAHQRLAGKPPVHRITWPVTPKVLKNSLEADLRRRQRVEQLLKEREEEELLRPMPKAKPAPQISRPPLQAENRRNVAITLTKVEPFNLSAERRVQQRRLYNQQTTRSLEAKRQELEEQRQREEREAYLKQRKLTRFRAQPNPFAITPR